MKVKTAGCSGMMVLFYHLHGVTSPEGINFRVQGRVRKPGHKTVNLHLKVWIQLEQEVVP
jgi:hypothetical protein